MRAPASMYRTRQIVRHDTPIELPKCMYALKNIHSKRDGTSDVQTEGKAAGSVFEQDNQQLPGMAELEAKQEEILRQLADLKQQILTIKSGLDITEGTAQKCIPIACRPQKATVSNMDVILKANPSTVPYSLEIVQKLLKDTVSFVFSFHLHSSVSSLSEQVNNFENALTSFPTNPNVPTVNIRLIWKNIGSDLELQVSTYPIVGEVNLLRYLSRTIPSLLSYSGDSDSVAVDSLLDIVYFLKDATTKTESMSMMRELNRSLGKDEWFLGRKKCGIVDVAAYSAVRQCFVRSDLGANLSKWFQRCEKEF